MTGLKMNLHKDRAGSLHKPKDRNVCKHHHALATAHRGAGQQRAVRTRRDLQVYYYYYPHGLKQKKQKNKKTRDQHPLTGLPASRGP